ncbi:MAG: hypothetical protein FJY26_12675 [Betaproteobacteria bacterium]|nr:hypothetical protein [Betaproteobacteria bacterium]
MLVIDNTHRKVDEDYDIVVWDKALDCAVGFCSQENDGTFTGWVSYGQHELPVSGDSPREPAQSALKAVNLTSQLPRRDALR